METADPLEMVLPLPPCRNSLLFGFPLLIKLEDGAVVAVAPRVEGANAGSCLNAQDAPRLHIPRTKKAHTGLSTLGIEAVPLATVYE